MRPFRFALIVVVIGLSFMLGRLAWTKYLESVIFDQHYISLPPDATEDLAGKTFSIKKIQILRGDFFEITIHDNVEKRVLGVLSVSATDDAKVKVLDLMNHCSEPKVHLKYKGADGRWLVEINFLYNEKGVNLSTWLTQNGLTYK